VSGSLLSKTGDLIEIQLPHGARHAARLSEISEVVLTGNISLTTPCLHELLRRGVTVSWCAPGGWFLGHAAPAYFGNAALRIAQHRAADNPAAALAIARALVAAKIANSRVLLRRNRTLRAPLIEPLAGLDQARRRADAAADIAALNGVEGAAAALFFPALGALLAPPGRAAALRLETRSRQPPRDPVNPLLSFTYALLVRSCILALNGAGFDIARGFLHQPRAGRPALALDLMEPLRPVLAEVVVLKLVNTGQVNADDFTAGDEGVRILPAARRAVVAAYEERLEESVRHPTGGRMRYRQLIASEARRLAGHLLGREPVPDFFVRR
jgi:CRISPR-associated endonuclease Cas1